MSPNLDFLDAAGSRLKRWSLAAVFVVTMYASACALALVNWTEEEVIEETRGAFLVEIADEAVAPPAEKLNLALGPPQEEVAAASAVAPTPAVQEKSDIETPKIEEAPLAPKPEVVVQKQQPVEKPDEKEVKEDPRPQQVNVEQASAAPQHAKAPPPTEAPVAAVAAAPRQGISSKPSEANLTWQKAVALHLNKHKTYPAQARENGDEGVAMVSITIDRSGKVISARLLTTSGFQLLDKEAVEVASRASPLPKPPGDMMELAYDFSQPIRFRMKK
jgi:protein TonB